MFTQNSGYGFAMATVLTLMVVATFVALYHALGHTQLY
jgi:Tfp pilus assembly protein PilX